MRSRFTIATLSGKTNRPPPGCCATAEIAASMSVALRTDAVTTSMPSDGPMDCRRRAKEADPVLAGAEFDRIGNKHKHLSVPKTPSIGFAIAGESEHDC